MGIDDVIAQMSDQAGELRRARDARLAFHATYLRTTQAVAAALREGLFADADWVDRWDVAFARLYTDALAADQRGEPVPAPWAVAFGAAERQRELPPVRHVLLGMNAHINYDLPQALLAVISDEEFADPGVLARREADHRRIDEVLSARVREEDAELQQTEPVRNLRDRLLQPANRMATQRFLRESRAKVWANAVELSRARQAGGEAYARRLAQLEELCGRRVADLVRPGPVLLRLAVGGFGVRLPAGPPAAAPGSSFDSSHYVSGSPGSAAGTALPGAVTRGGAPASGGGAGKLARVLAGRRRKPSRSLRTFDPLLVGRLECDLWVTYYRREWARFLITSLRLVRGTFGMDWTRTVHGAWLVLRANQLWAPSRGDPAAARRCMRRFYGLLLLSHGEPADPARAAQLEVDWWRVHREHQRGEDGDAGPLVTALTRLYAFVYDTSEEAVRTAAGHRARAMDISDRWVEEGCDLASPLVPAERAELVRSYAALLAAVHR